MAVNNNNNNNNNNIREQFICLMERVCYITYFPESVSSIPSQQKNVINLQNNLRKTVKWVI